MRPRSHHNSHHTIANGRTGSILDWQPLKRTIFLAYVSMGAPLVYGMSISLLYFKQVFGETSVVLHPSFPLLYLGLMAGHLLVLWRVIKQADSAYEKDPNAQREDLWYIVALTHVAQTLLTSFLVGTYYADGMLMLLLGFSLSLPLQSITSLRRTWFFAVLVFALLTYVDLSGTFPSGQLFNSNTAVDPKSTGLFLYTRVLIAFGTFGMAFFVLSRTIAQWQQREDFYFHLSNTDSLTRLSNRNHFLDRGQKEFKMANRHTDALTCLFLDIDHFKKINDNHGHYAGDQVLIKIAEILADNARDYDEVSRLGGEEFAILMPATNAQAALKFAQRIRDHIEHTIIEVDQKKLQVTISIGLASYPDLAVDTLEDLLKKADEALYQAKRSGRNKVMVAGNRDTDFSATA